MVEMSDLETRLIHWPISYRIVSSRFPPIDIFENVLSNEQFEAAFLIDSLTNDRLRDETGDIDLVAPHDRVFGPGTSAIMAAFTHVNPDGSRFSDGSYGVYYCAREVETAIAETIYHLKRLLKQENEPAQTRQMRVYQASVSAELVIVDKTRKYREILRKTDYAASQQLGRNLKSSGAWGVQYPSVRHDNGLCAGLFRPKAIFNCNQGDHYAYQWDGKDISVERLHS